MTDLGTAIYTELPAQKNYPFACNNGWHPEGEDCVSNTDYCKKGKWIALTTSCGSCNWYTFHVKNTTVGSRTGDYCETRWYMYWLFALGNLLVIAFFVWLAWYFCCRGSKKSTPNRYQEIAPIPQRKPEPVVEHEKPLPPPRREPVHVAPPPRPAPVYHAPAPVYHAPAPVYHAPAPVYHDSPAREVRGEPRITYGEPVMRESRAFEGQREHVLVERRTYR